MMVPGRSNHAEEGVTIVTSTPSMNTTAMSRIHSSNPECGCIVIISLQCLLSSVLSLLLFSSCHADNSNSATKCLYYACWVKLTTRAQLSYVLIVRSHIVACAYISLLPCALVLVFSIPFIHLPANMASDSARKRSQPQEQSDDETENTAKRIALTKQESEAVTRGEVRQYIARSHTYNADI